MADRDRIPIDPNVGLGLPTIRGLRIAVGVVLKMLPGGNSADVLEVYPELEPDDVAQALP